jgi:hypothetical protein
MQLKEEKETSKMLTAKAQDFKIHKLLFQKNIQRG